MKSALPLLLTMAVCMSGCERMADYWQKPEVGPAYTLPAPPIGDVEIRLYPPSKTAKTTAPSPQIRNGDCQPETCFVYENRHWYPLKKTDAQDVAYLSVMMPTGSDYSPDLWRAVGTSGHKILVSSAGVDGIARGMFDGLRIGIGDTTGVTYFTAYSVEKAATLTAHGICQRDMALDAGNPAKAGCAQKVASDSYVLPVNGDVIIAGDRVWLLQRRPDRSANLIDLLALPKGPVVCLPGLIIDTQGQWMGPPESALSPNLFVSRSRVTPDYEAHKKALLKACP